MTATAQEIQDWIVARINALTGMSAAEIDVEGPIDRLGLDSVQMLVLTADLETWLGFRFRADPLEEHSTIAALARFVAEQIDPKRRQA